MVFISDGAAWIFSNAVACGSKPMNAKQMRMNTMAATPMRIRLGRLFFFISVGSGGREKSEWIIRDVPQDEEEEENGGDGECEWLVVLKLGISPDKQRADDAWKQDRIATQCFERMSMEQGMDGSRAAAARAVHACQ